MRESRLKFTDKERLDPVMGKVVQKAEKAADKAEKAQAKIPTKKVIKRELITDNSNGKIKVKLHCEATEKKPPSQLKVTDAPAAAVRRQIRREIRESEDDNVGVEAASSALDSAEGTGYLLQEAHHSAQLQPYRAAARAEKQLERANIHALQKKAEVEHPTRNPFPGGVRSRPSSASMLPRKPDAVPWRAASRLQRKPPRKQSRLLPSWHGTGKVLPLSSASC